MPPVSQIIVSPFLDLKPAAPIDVLARLEPNASEATLVPGFRALIADPLWLLGRQWQLGELRGEDASTPVRVALELELVAVDRLAIDGVSAAPVDPSAPIEAYVEAIDVDAPNVNIRRAAELGLLARRALLAANAGAVWTALCSRPELRIDLTRLDIGDAALRLLARRSLDGVALARRLDALPAVDAAAGLAAITLLPASGLQAAAAALVAWRVQTATTVERPAKDAWDHARFEHRFALRSADGALDLQAAEHPGGRLDWYSVDIHVAATPASKRPTMDAIPIPIQFPGMPSRRWWDLEDEAVDLSNVEAGPEDMIRMLSVELMTIFADDWYLVPVRMPVGHLARIRSVTVDDAFAYKQAPRTLASFAEQDGAARTWRMFELTGQPQPKDNIGPWLFVAPVVADLLESDPIEEVRFLRDEVSNLGWAVERTIEGVDGRPRRRAEPRTTPPAPRGDAGWAWQLVSTIPLGWTPFVPAATGDGTNMALQRARLPHWTATDGPQGALLTATTPLVIPEEEIPATGIVLTRTWQRTRGTNGEVLLWQGREKRPGTGEPAAELIFDRLLR